MSRQNPVWSAAIPGDAEVAVLGVDPDATSVYVADGWGVAYAALRLRRLSLDTGEELATVRLGNSARCITFHDGELLAATDTKVFRLVPKTLEIVGRWDKRVPRYTDTIVADDGRLRQPSGS